MTSRKRTRGAVRNIANQLAQIAAGWEAQFDGPVLLGEPHTGTYVIDLVRNVATINERETDLGMKMVLTKWLDGELNRLGQGDRDGPEMINVASDEPFIRSLDQLGFVSLEPAAVTTPT